MPSRKLYEIWQDETGLAAPSKKSWCLQMHNYVAHFETEIQAQRYASAVQLERKKQGLK